MAVAVLILTAPAMMIEAEAAVLDLFGLVVMLLLDIY
nr:MAG TPA: hypothetical protein [Caudoviricetes sp.]